MSVKTMSWALDLPIPPVPKLVLLTLANYANDDGYCFPGQASIAAKASVGVRTLRRHLADLEDMGLLTRTARQKGVGKGRGRTSDAYQLHVHVQPDDLAEWSSHDVSDDQPATTNRPDQTTNRPSEARPTGHLETTNRPLVAGDITVREPSEKPSELLAPASPGAVPARRDLLFEAIAEACGVDWSKLTRNGRGELNKAASDLRAVGATPGEVRSKALIFAARFPNVGIPTPSALAKHWAGLTTASLRTVHKHQIQLAAWAAQEDSA